MRSRKKKSSRPGLSGKSRIFEGLRNEQQRREHKALPEVCKARLVAASKKALLMRRQRRLFGRTRWCRSPAYMSRSLTAFLQNITGERAKSHRFCQNRLGGSSLSIRFCRGRRCRIWRMGSQAIRIGRKKQSRCRIKGWIRQRRRGKGTATGQGSSLRIRCGASWKMRWQRMRRHKKPLPQWKNPE